MDITDWRKRIDQLDQKLVELLNERARYVAEIGRLKWKAGVRLYQPEREREILQRVQQLNGGPLGNAALKRLFERIVGEARVVEQDAYRGERVLERPGGKNRGRRHARGRK